MTEQTPRELFASQRMGAANDHTPTDEEIRAIHSDENSWAEPEDQVANFDRWLAAHDERVYAEARRVIGVELGIEPLEESSLDGPVPTEHNELANIVAYTEDDYLRERGSLSGSAQAVADAIQAAGYRKGPQLSEAELELIRLALQIAIGQSRSAVPLGSHRHAGRSGLKNSDSARKRRYRVLLEKLGGSKIPVAPVEDEEPAKPELSESDSQPKVSSWEREKKRRREISKLRQSSRVGPHWRYRQKLRGVPQKSVGDIYATSPHAQILKEALRIEPGAETSEDFKRGFFAARTVAELQGAAALERFGTLQWEFGWRSFFENGEEYEWLAVEDEAAAIAAVAEARAEEDSASHLYPLTFTVWKRLREISGPWVPVDPEAKAMAKLNAEPEEGEGSHGDSD